MKFIEKPEESYDKITFSYTPGLRGRVERFFGIPSKSLPETFHGRRMISDPIIQFDNEISFDDLSSIKIKKLNIENYELHGVLPYEKLYKLTYRCKVDYMEKL